MIRVPPPLADSARPASHPGTCVLCRQDIRLGDRIARLPDSTWAHVWPCLVALAEGRQAP